MVSRSTSLTSSRCSLHLLGTLWATRLQESVKVYWVAAKELKLSYYIGEILLLTVYIYISIMVT